MIYVTSPIMPDFEEFVSTIRELWHTRNLTNNGTFLKAFETALEHWLGVPYVSVMTNGTLPIMLALRSLGVESGEVITTPYTFVATSGVLEWMGLRPVFADVEEGYGTLSPSAAERLITPRTRAILPVHVHGYPCAVDDFAELSKRYDIPVIYDAAHAFGVKSGGHSILLHGDMATLSFHATKVFNSLEGGAVVCSSLEQKQRLDRMRNFGITGEVSVESEGLNAKMDEMRAAYGLLNLRNIDASIRQRKHLSKVYDGALQGVRGVRHPAIADGVEYNYAYYTLYIDAQEYGHTRDELYLYLKEKGIHARRYFYPLVSDFEPYKKYLKAAQSLPVASLMASQVMCLPLYPHLSEGEIKEIAALISDFSLKI